jgi:hypothetical protein
MALAGVRMDRLHESPLYRRLADQNRLPRFDAFHADVHDLLLASDDKDVLAIARGRFETKPAAGLNANEYRGYTLYAKDPRAAYAFVGKDIALGGPVALLRAAIDQSKNGGGAPRDLMARAQELPADPQIWVVITGWRGLAPDQLSEMGNLGNLDRVLRLVRSASLTVDLRAGAHAIFTGDSRTEADAKTLADSLRGLAALARLGAARKQPDLARALDLIQVKQDGLVVQVDANIPEDLAEKLAR